MPLHKSSRASRLDPTMISAPLGDFRHTMHIGRGGDTFGDTSFLSTVGPSPSSTESQGGGAVPPPPETPVDLADANDATDANDTYDALHSESVSSFTLDLDLDLGPSMLGDVLGVMDGLGADGEVFSPAGSISPVDVSQGKNGPAARSVELRNELNGKTSGNLEGDTRIPDGDPLRLHQKSLRPKVRFSDKRDEIIRRASEEDEEDEEEGQGFDFQDEEDEPELRSPAKADDVIAVAPTTESERVELPPSPASSHSSEYEGVTELDRRKADLYHSETDSEDDEEEEGRGYTFEDEFDDEIGL